MATRKSTRTARRAVTTASRQFKNQGYEGARFSQNRGYVYFPTLDSARDLDSYSLYELRRKSRWLYVNSGFATRCIDGIANMVGSLTPVPLTADKEWNQLALRRFNDMAGNAGVFDAGARFDFWRAQIMFTRLRLTDGDVAAVLTATNQDVGRVAFYEAHQIDNPKDKGAARWCDGVLTSKQGRPIKYNIVTGDQYSTDRTDTAISAEDFIFHCEYRRPGRCRGEPSLRHAINHLLDASEIIGFTKTSIKNAAQIGYQITRNATEFQSGPTWRPIGMGSGARNSTVETSGGTAQIKIEDALKAGKIAEMNPGEEVKMLLDQRPHPNQVEFLEYLSRDIAWGLNCSSDILWNIAKLGGATVRYVMADAQQGVIEPNQELLADQFCSRFWIYFLAKEMNRGALPMCEDPEWWKHGWQPQQKLTVDIGRDGKLYIDMHKSGMISLKRYHAQLGQNWKQETDDYLDERAYIIQAVKDRGLTMDEAFPPEPGTANATVQQDEHQNPDDPQNKANKEHRNSGKDGDDMTHKEFLAALAAIKPQGHTINIPPINIPKPNIIIDKLSIPPQPAPVVNFTPKIQPVIDISHPPAVVNIPKNDIIVPAPQVTVNVPPAEVRIENKIDVPATQSIKVKRDKEGNMTGIDVTKS